MDWFRMYNEVLDDAKIQTLPDRLVRSWLNLLCLASKHGGVLPPISDIAFRLRVSTERAQQILDELGPTGRGLFDRTEDGVQPHNWNSRQYVSDSSTKRVRKHREKLHRNVSETPSDTDTDTEAEQTQKQSAGAEAIGNRLSGPALSGPGGRGAGAAGDDFQEFRSVAESVGMNGSEPDWEEARFEWKRLDFEQKLAAVAGIRERAGTDDPALKALPKNYLARRMWERKIRAPAERPKSAIEQLRERAKARVQ